ncbi:MAG: hypothetical protein ACR2PG_25920 [Hyphomicrobiaceae bacterium]
MPDFIYNLSSYTLAINFGLLAVAAVLVGILIIKPILRLLIGTGPEFNQTISYSTSGFNLFYGLLLGLLTVAAYQNSERVKEGILAEATTLGSLYADMNSYPEPLRSEMKSMLRDYVLFTIYKDWPAHREGIVLDGGFNRTGAMRQKLASFAPQTRGQQVLHAETISAFQDFSEARQKRLTGTITEIPSVLWYAVLVGAGINLLLLVLLRIRLVQQFALGTITMFFLGVILVVIITLDKPLRGQTGLNPEPLKLLWDRAMVWDEPLRLGGSYGEVSASRN